MTADEPLHGLTIAEASRRIEDGVLSPVALLGAVLARIEAVEERVHAYVRPMHDTARLEAEAAERRQRQGQRRGPLDGIPIAVKDIFDTAGVVTAGGSRAFRDRVPVEDANAVRLMHEAGAVIVGKSNTHELAFGGTTNNAWYGATHNPWQLDRVPGGSSGGSAAAVAAGEALGALGTDTAGSIRIPAVFCHLTGHKPTFGLVGRGGIMPLALTLDNAGPIARTAEDCALMLNALVGSDDRDPDCTWNRPESSPPDYTAELDRGVEGLRLAVVPSMLLDCEDAVLEHFERSLDVLRGLGAEIVRAEPMAGELRWRERGASIMSVEGASYIEDILRDSPASIAPPVRRLFEGGLNVPATVYARALQVRKLVEQRFERGLTGIDGYVVPTSPLTPEPIDPDPHAETRPNIKHYNAVVFDYSRQPAITVPNGLDAQGLPTGLMIATRRFSDGLTLRIAHAYQQATDHHRQHAPLD